MERLLILAAGEASPVNTNVLLTVVTSIAGIVVGAFMLMLRNTISEASKGRSEFTEIGREFAKAMAQASVESAETRNTFEQTIAGLMNEHREDRYAYRDSMKEVTRQLGSMDGKLDGIRNEIHKGVEVAKEKA